MLIPSLSQMLTVAEGMGIEDVELAWDNYTRHYDVFFDISSYAVQQNALIEEMFKLGLLEASDNPEFKYQFSDKLSVKEALLIVNSSNQSDKSS